MESGEQEGLEKGPADWRRERRVKRSAELLYVQTIRAVAAKDAQWGELLSEAKVVDHPEELYPRVEVPVRAALSIPKQVWRDAARQLVIAAKGDSALRLLSGYVENDSEWPSIEVISTQVDEPPITNRLGSSTAVPSAVRELAELRARLAVLEKLVAEAVVPKAADTLAQDAPDPASFLAIGERVGRLLEEKNRAYGDSFNRAPRILAELYPDGIPVEAFPDALAIIRVVDKLKRIATDRDALGETPWQDIAGYAILALERMERQRGTSGG